MGLSRVGLQTDDFSAAIGCDLCSPVLGSVIDHDHLLNLLESF
jgi:hypothetical protein